MKKGIDISYHQGVIDFSQVKQSGIDFVILREGYGTNTDPKFTSYVRAAKEAGIPIRGVYHFSYALNKEQAKAEAEICVKNMQAAGLGPDVMVFFDFEYDTVNHAAKRGVLLNASECNLHTLVFCDQIKMLGYTPGVYTNLDYYKNMYDKELLKKYPIWLADYSGDADIPCLYHQYTSKGSVPGIKGNVDMNFYYGEDSEEKKSVDVIANEVINGLWGNGEERKQKLSASGWSYVEVQAKVNEILNGPAEQPKEVPADKVESAKKKDPALAGAYVTTANLYCRVGAGKNKTAICRIPKGTKVQNYGFYTESGGVKWLLIRVTLNGTVYTGFSSISYLKR